MTTTFADLIQRGTLILNDGYRTKQAELAPSGIPILRVAEIGDGFLAPKSEDRIGEEYRDVIGVKLSRAGDVLLTTKGTVGRRAIVPESGAGFAYSPQVCFFRVLDDSIDRRWLYYWLGGTEFWDQALGVSTQTDMAPYISLRDLRAISIDLPPISEQREIAATLGALDEKIESNRRAAATLVALISALFEQVISSPEVVYAPLGEFTRAVTGRSYKSSELQESSTALVTLKSVDRNGGYKESGLKPYTGPHKPEQEVRPGEIVVAQTDLTQGAEVVGRGVRVPRSGRYGTLVASLDLAIVRPVAGMPVEYLHGLLSSEAFRQHCRAHVTGTTVLHLAKDAMPTWSAPIVPRDEQERFAESVRPMLARMDALSEESTRLVALRYALLPEMLSGRVRVPVEGVIT